MMPDPRRARFAILIAAAVWLGTAGPAALAKNDTPYPGTTVVATKQSFDQLWASLEAAIKANNMGIVGRASASRGAAGRGVKIPGNLVIGVYRNDFAVRMLAASVAAGIEAPLRFYVTEGADGTATLTYRRPSAVFAPYESPALDEMAKELDRIWEKIAAAATAG